MVVCAPFEYIYIYILLLGLPTFPIREGLGTTMVRTPSPTTEHGTADKDKYEYIFLEATRNGALGCLARLDTQTQRWRLSLCISNVTALSSCFVNKRL